MKRWLKKLRHRRQLDRDLEDELAFHLEQKAAETGDPLEARRKLGNPSLLKETCRDLWTFPALETWWQDIRYALRTLARHRGVTAVAVAALALGIGADTAVFTFVKGALSFDPGIDHAEQVVMISGTNPLRSDDLPQPDPDLRNFRSQVKSLSQLAAYRFTSVNLTDQNAPPERYVCAQMSASGFTIAGRRPVLGRSFQPEDERPDAPPVLMLTHRVWQNRYGKNPGIIGRVVRVEETPRVIIGVMPTGMRFPEDTDLWIPLAPAHTRGSEPLLFGRLADGVKLAAARSEMDAIARRLTNQNPAHLKGLAIDVRPILEIYGVYQLRPLFLAVLCAVGFVVLIACANVANLLLARAAARAREISVRMAIGAGRMRIIRQLLVESVLLAATGGLFGWMIAAAGLRWFDASTAAFHVHPGSIFPWIAKYSCISPPCRWA
ncbi:MAG TPA: ABC transporter permease, partial [Bryobacteraceae bacterium]|nr:ABC transporter permease [Bryobacteraceae bacterium]